MALVFASMTLALCLLFLTGLLENLPKAVLAAVVLTAIYGLLDFPALMRMWRISRLDCYAATIALGAVLLLGILHGILLAAIASVLLLLARVSRPHVAFLGRIPGTREFSDMSRHPENEPLVGAIAFRPEASLIYVNADAVLEAVSERIRTAPSGVRLVVCDLSASPYVDLAGAQMLRNLQVELEGTDSKLRVVGARASVRDLLRAVGLDQVIGEISRTVTLEGLLRAQAPSVRPDI
jgi:MFS superfamily sulfate permease-like transporter